MHSPDVRGDDIGQRNPDVSEPRSLGILTLGVVGYLEHDVVAGGDLTESATEPVEL